MAWTEQGSLKGPAGSGGGSTDTWEYGPFAEANPSYKAAAKAAGVSGLRTVVLSDSTSDAFSGGRTGTGNQTSTRWQDAWPGRLNRKIRAQLGLPEGGVGWIPPNTPTPPGGYAYRTTLLEPSNWNTIDDLTFNQGIPGSMWLQRGRADGSAVYIDTVTYTLTPGTTSLDVYISGYGALIEIQTSNGAKNYQTAGNGDERRWITITNPGAQVRFRANSGQGFALLGLMEYAGDEIAGSKMMNLAIAGIRGEEVYSWLQDPSRAMKQSIARFAPQLAIVVLGSNDITYGRTPQEVLNTIGGVVLELRNAVPDINVLLVMRENPSTQYQQFVTLVKQNAANVGASVLDVGLEPRLDLSASGIYITDNEHYSAAGDEMMAVVMAEHLKVQKTSAGLTTAESAQVSSMIAAASTSFTERGPWAANTAYARGDTVIMAGRRWLRRVAGTSESTFNEANWLLLGRVNETFSDIPAGKWVVPQHMRGAAIASTVTQSQNTSHAVRFGIGRTCTITAVSVVVAATSPTNATAELRRHSFNRATGVLDSTGVVLGTLNTVFTSVGRKTLAVNIPVVAGDDLVLSICPRNVGLAGVMRGAAMDPALLDAPDSANLWGFGGWVGTNTPTTPTMTALPLIAIKADA